MKRELMSKDDPRRLSSHTTNAKFVALCVVLGCFIAGSAVWALHFAMP